MASLRSRLLWTTGLMVALQVTSTGLAITTWARVLTTTNREQDLADWRAAVDGLREASRESYVHQAHTFIEGGTGHLDHLGEADDALDASVASVEALPLSERGAATLIEVRATIEASRSWFHREVVPLAEAGTLDRPAAAQAHAQAERLAGAVSNATDRLAAVLDTEQAAERASVARLTRMAWQFTALFTLSGLGLALALASRLHERVLGPIGQLRAAAESFGAGGSVLVQEDADDELAELAAAFNTMTATVRAAQEAQVRAERLAALGELSAAVAHELMSPLTVILGHPAMQASALQPVREEAEHARRVVAGLLGFARPGEEAPEDVDLLAAVKMAIGRAEPEADHRDVRLILADGGPVRLRIPPGAVRHVLDNLLRNAIQASPAGAEVQLSLLQGPTLEVVDRGPGIPDAIRARLYEPFATGRPDGTGLGLAVCQRIARGTGGALEHQTRPGGGTIARWRLTTQAL